MANLLGTALSQRVERGGRYRCGTNQTLAEDYGE
jgi:hypothetical protein